MFRKLRAYLKQYPRLVELYRSLFVRSSLYNRWNDLRDIGDSYILKSRTLQTTPYGFKLSGSRNIHHRAMQIGKFEESEMSLIQQHLSQASVFVDVGANIGFYACIALMVGKRVIAIEPQPQNLKYLYENLHVNGWQDVEVYPVGLSSKPGVLDLYGASTTGASLIPGWAGATQRVRRVIPVSTLDILLGERFAGEKLFIKIDVEGVEYDVLLGASRTIKLSPRPTWMIETCLSEFHPDGLNPNFAATFEAFWRHGYEVRTADQRNVLIEPADVKRWINARHCDSGTINYIFR